VAEPAFAEALADWCEHERDEVARYAQTLSGHSPFKSEDPA
jgi:predicted N-acyltransferase